MPVDIWLRENSVTVYEGGTQKPMTAVYFASDQHVESSGATSSASLLLVNCSEGNLGYFARNFLRKNETISAEVEQKRRQENNARAPTTFYFVLTLPALETGR